MYFCTLLLILTWYFFMYFSFRDTYLHKVPCTRSQKEKLRRQNLPAAVVTSSPTLLFWVLYWPLEYQLL